MSAVFKEKSSLAHDARAHKTVSARSRLDDQVFRLNLETILSAHDYGHIDQAYALRAIARAIKEFLI